MFNKNLLSFTMNALEWGKDKELEVRTMGGEITRKARQKRLLICASIKKFLDSEKSRPPHLFAG